MIPECRKEAQDGNEEGYEGHPQRCPAGDREVPECEEKEQKSEDDGRDSFRSTCPWHRHREFRPEKRADDEHVQDKKYEPEAIGARI